MGFMKILITIAIILVIIIVGGLIAYSNYLYSTLNLYNPPKQSENKDQAIKITILNSWCEKEVFTFNACYNLCSISPSYIIIVDSNHEVLFNYQNVKKNSYSIEYK